MKKIVMMLFGITVGFLICRANIPYEGVAHDFASYQPAFSTHQHDTTLKKFYAYAKEHCPALGKKIQAQIKNSPAMRLYYAPREGSGRGQAIRQDTVQDCMSESK